MPFPRNPPGNADEARSRADALAADLIDCLKQAGLTQYRLGRQGYEVQVLGGAAAIREVDTTEYDESNEGEGPD